MRRIAVLVTLCLFLSACPPSRKVSQPKNRPDEKAAPREPVRAPAVTEKPAKDPTATEIPDKAAAVDPSVPPKAANAGTSPNPNAKGSKPPPPTKSSTPGKVNRPKPHAVPLEDGPALGSVLTTVASLEPVSPKKDMIKVSDAKVIKAVLRALNTGQTLKGGRKGCKFVYSFLLKGARGKDLGAVSLCGPVGANTLAIFSDNSTWKEWQISVPNSKGLAALLDKHLPGAKK